MEKKHSHLTLDERIVIEQGIKRKMSFSSIAASIGKDRSTVSREVQRKEQEEVSRFVIQREDPMQA